jgi:hypothetical protein
MRQVLLEGRALHIFPCRADKTPACEHWFNDAVADQAGIDRLWSAVWPRNRPTALIGVPTGVISGIAVIDIDPRRGGDKWFFENRDRLPNTRTHETQHFGQHLIYRHLSGVRCSNSRIAPGVDVKGDGGYVIWWPEHGCSVLCEGPVAEFPRWLFDELVTRIIKRSASIPRGNGPLMAVAGTNHLPRDLYFRILSLVPHRHYHRRVRGILSVVVYAVEGTRNTRLNWAAYSMRELIEAGVISRANAETLLMQAAEHYAAADGVNAAMATIRSGLGSAIRGPAAPFDEAS